MLRAINAMLETAIQSNKLFALHFTV